MRRSGPFSDSNTCSSPPVAPEERSNTYLIFPHLSWRKQGISTGIFSSKWLRKCVCLLHLPCIASGGTQLERKTPKGYYQKEAAMEQNTPSFLHLYFSYPWQMKTLLWIYPHLAIPFLPFSIPPSSHTCSMQISSDGSESGLKSQTHVLGSLSNLYTYRNELWCRLIREQ